MSLLLIPTSNVDLHNRPPQQNTKKSFATSIPSRHVFFTSCCVTASRCTRFVCLFVRPFICWFGWLLRRLSAPCCHFPSRRVATPHRCAASRLPLSLSFHFHQVITSSRLVLSSPPGRCVASRSSCVASRSIVILLPRFI